MTSKEIKLFGTSIYKAQLQHVIQLCPSPANTFPNNITNFIRSNGYHEYFLIFFFGKKKNNAYSRQYKD